MKRSQKAALLTLLDREMLNKGSWCGETHLQKATFFLQELLGVDTDFEFILYRHGPFSFELRDELSSMQADGLLELVVRREGYGPTYVPTSFSEIYLKRFPNTTSRNLRQVQFVSEELSDKGVAELERLATALFIVNRGRRSLDEQVETLVDLKPHISPEDAEAAFAQVDRLIKLARPYRIPEEESAVS